LGRMSARLGRSLPGIVGIMLPVSTVSRIVDFDGYVE
jgi:hypothetical protein